MDGATKKIQKLRTFQSDMASARGPVSETPRPSATVTETAPPSKLPPVLNAKKPEASPVSLTVPPRQDPPTVPVRPMVSAPPKMATSQTQTRVDSALRPMPDPAAPAVVKAAIETNDLIKSTPDLMRPPEPVRVMETLGDTSSRGTVITNQKRGRFKLFPAIWEGLTQWFYDTERALEKRAEKKRLAIPTVRSIEERKDTVKKAGAVGALAPKDDHAKLAEKLPPKLKKTTAASTPIVTIAAKEAIPAPSWSHFDGQNPADISPSSPMTTRVASTMPIMPETPATPTTPPPPPPPPVMPEPNIQVATIPITSSSIPAADPVRSTTPEKKPTTVEPMKVEIGRKTKPVVVSKKTPYARRNFRWLFYVGVATTAIFATLGGAGLVNWLLGESSTTDIPVATTDLPTTFVTPVPQSAVAKIVLPRDRADWYASVLQATGNDMTTIMPVINIGGAENPASTEAVLATLDLRVEPALTRSIKDVTFMMISNKPAIVLEVTSYDSSFGGLLLSEQNLSGELAPLFGPRVNVTYKPGVGTVSPEFVDELADNHDVRVLKDETENERLVYGFIDQNTVIIAPDRETFSSLAARLR